MTAHSALFQRTVVFFSIPMPSTVTAKTITKTVVI